MLCRQSSECLYKRYGFPWRFQARELDLGDCEWRTEADHRVHRKRNYDGAVFSCSDVDISGESGQKLEEDTVV